MALKDYIPNRDGDLDNWETNFTDKVDAIATTLAIPPDEVTPVKVLIAEHQTKYDTSVSTKAAAKAANNTARTARTTTVAAVRKLANRMKSALGYTTDLGNQLGIVGEDSTFNPATAKPVIKVRLGGGNIIIEFDHPRGVDGVRIYSKRGNETAFAFLAVDTASPYEDNRANLTPGTAEQRSYYAFFFDDDQNIGLQSDEVSISITK